MQQPHPPIYTAAATTPASASFAGKVGQGLVQPGYLGIPFELVRGLTETYRKIFLQTSKSDVVLGIHLHVARDREEAIDNGALALSSQAEVFLRGRLSRPVQAEQIQTYASKSASKEAFEKLHTPEKARDAVVTKGRTSWPCGARRTIASRRSNSTSNALHPEQLMLNIASGSLAQDKALKSMRLFAEEVMPAVREL